MRALSLGAAAHAAGAAGAAAADGARQRRRPHHALRDAGGQPPGSCRARWGWGCLPPRWLGRAAPPQRCLHLSAAPAWAVCPADGPDALQTCGTATRQSRQRIGPACHRPRASPTRPPTSRLLRCLAPGPPLSLQEDFRGVVVESEGFEYRAERPNEATFVGQKWGWTADTPGEAWQRLRPASRCRECACVRMRVRERVLSVVCTAACLAKVDTCFLPAAGAWAELEFDSRRDATREASHGNWASVYLSHLKASALCTSRACASTFGCACH